MSYQVLHAGACRHPDNTAVIYHDTPISYAMLVNALDATIQVIERYRLPVEQPVGIVIQHLLDSWVVVLALQALGITTVCARSVDVIEALGMPASTVLVTTESDSGKQACERAAGQSGCLICIPAPSLRRDISDLVPELRRDAKFGNHVVYTSGTTGNYKKVLWGGSLQQRRNSERADSRQYCGADTVYYGSDYGLWTGAGYRMPLLVWQLGGCVIFDQRPQWFEHFLQYPMTHATLIPDKVHQLLVFLRNSNVTEPLHSMEVMVTGGFMSRNVAEELMQRVTRNLVYAYGSTEINPITMESRVGNLDELQWLVPASARTVEIVDESGALCAAGEEGYLRIRSTELDCAGYLDAPQANDNVYKQGWFYPGDMAIRRADGRIRILGRSADVFNLRGQKYAVAPFEQEIQRRLGVDAVCLFSGIGGAGEEIVVIALETAQQPEQKLLDSIGREFKQFEQVKFALFPRFPRTQTGMSKIDRVELRKQVFSGEGGAAAN